MSDPFPPPQTRIYFNPPPRWRVFGCGGCGIGCLGFLLLVFFAGGVFGILLSGWRALLHG